MSRRSAILQDYGGNFQPMPQESQLQAAQLQERSNEFNTKLKADKKDKSDKASQDFINGLGIDHIGDNTIDILTDKQIQALQSKLTDMQLKGASTTDLQVTAQRELPQIVNGHTVAKNNYNQIKAGITELGKDYPTGDLEAARTQATTNMLKDVLNFDDKGNAIGYKDPSLVPQKDYVSPLRENPSGWYNQSGSVVKGVQGLPMTSYSDIIESRNKKGESVKNKYSGQLNAFTQVDQDPNTHEPIGISVKSEPITLGKNPDGSANTINVLPKTEFEMLTDTPQKKMDFQLMYHQHLKDINVDPQSLDPRANDVYQRKFAKDWLEETKIHGGLLNKERMDNQPLPPRISIKVGEKDVPVVDIVKPVQDYFNANPGNYINYTSPDGTNKKLSGVAQLNMFNNEVTSPIVDEVKKRYPGEDVTADRIYYQHDGNDTWVMKTKKSKVIDPNTDTPVFKLDDFSNIVGNKSEGQKSVHKATVIAQQANGNPTPKSEIVEQNGHQYKLNKKTGQYEPLK